MVFCINASYYVTQYRCVWGNKTVFKFKLINKSNPNQKPKQIEFNSKFSIFVYAKTKNFIQNDADNILLPINVCVSLYIYAKQEKKKKKKRWQLMFGKVYENEWKLVPSEIEWVNITLGKYLYKRNIYRWSINKKKIKQTNKPCVVYT